MSDDSNDMMAGGRFSHFIKYYDFGMSHLVSYHQRPDIVVGHDAFFWMNFSSLVRFGTRKEDSNGSFVCLPTLATIMPPDDLGLHV